MISLTAPAPAAAQPRCPPDRGSRSRPRRRAPAARAARRSAPPRARGRRAAAQAAPARGAAAAAGGPLRAGRSRRWAAPAARAAARANAAAAASMWAAERCLRDQARRAEEGAVWTAQERREPGAALGRGWRGQGQGAGARVAPQVPDEHGPGVRREATAEEPRARFAARGTRHRRWAGTNPRRNTATVPLRAAGRARRRAARGVARGHRPRVRLAGTGRPTRAAHPRYGLAANRSTSLRRVARTHPSLLCAGARRVQPLGRTRARAALRLERFASARFSLTRAGPFFRKDYTESRHRRVVISRLHPASESCLTPGSQCRLSADSSPRRDDLVGAVVFRIAQTAVGCRPGLVAQSSNTLAQGPSCCVASESDGHRLPRATTRRLAAACTDFWVTTVRKPRARVLAPEHRSARSPPPTRALRVERPRSAHAASARQRLRQMHPQPRATRPARAALTRPPPPARCHGCCSSAARTTAWSWRPRATSRAAAAF